MSTVNENNHSTHYMHSSGNYFPQSAFQNKPLPELPPATYVVKMTPEGVLYFSQVEDFLPLGRIYGNILQRADRIMSTFEARPAGTGLLLSGDAGSGKSMLAKQLCNMAREAGMPVILINSAWRGESFNALIQNITQPAVILFDEFEKVYDSDEQNEMLTLLDGVFPSKKLYILTCNDTYKLNRYMLNRPGRLFYHLEYNGLDESIIREYCEEKLANKEHINALVGTTKMFDTFNFDMLKAIVEECNRYSEAPRMALEMLNMKPGLDDVLYSIAVSIKGELREDLNTQWWGQPLRQSFGVNLLNEDQRKSARGELKARLLAEKKRVEGMSPTTTPISENITNAIFGSPEPEQSVVSSVVFESEDIKGFDVLTGRYLYEKEVDGYGLVELTLTRNVVKARSYVDMMV